MIIRELVALLGIKTDPSGFKKAEGGMKRVVGWVKTAAAAYVGFQGLRIFKNAVIDAASDANETLNVLSASFKENQQDVINWANSFAAEAGRSKYQMREISATLGAVLNPLMEGNAKAAADMSTRLAELTVDLGSFYNAAEPDVLLALRSGITGEAEPLKRFGIVMSVATLEAYALAQGITKSFSAMSVAEKTALRYQFIVETTANAHGDAAKTSEGFANASKALGGMLKDVGTDVGLKLLPTVEEAIKLFKTWVPGFKRVAMGAGRLIRTIAKVTMWVLKLVTALPRFAKIALVVVGFLRWGKAVRFLLSPMGKVAVLVGLLILIVEDLITWVEGGDSVFGRLFDTLDELTGLPVGDFFKEIIRWTQKLASDPEGAFEDFRDMLSGVGTWYAELFQDIWSAMQSVPIIEWLTNIIGFIINVGRAIFETLFAIIEFFMVAFEKPAEAWNYFVQNLGSIWRETWNDILAFFNAIIDTIAPIFWNMFPSFKAPLTEFAEWVAGWAKRILKAIMSPIETFTKVKNKVAGWLGFGDVKVDGFKVAGARKALGPEGVGGGVGARARPGVSAGGLVNSPTTNLNISVKTGAGASAPEVAESIRRVVGKEIEKGNRAAMMALKPKKAAAL